MRRTCWILVFLALAVTPSIAQVDRDDYVRAESRLPANIRPLVKGMDVHPQWLDGSSLFWHRWNGTEGVRYLLVDPDARTQEPLFDHAILAAALGDSVDADALDLTDLEVDTDGALLRFAQGKKRWIWDGVELKENPEEELPAGASPDGRWQVNVREHDLWLVDRATGDERRLTEDGTADHGYGLPLASARTMVAQGTDRPELEPHVLWLDDARHFVTVRLDTRDAGTYTLVQAVPPGETTRPRAYTYAYPLPGETTLPTMTILVGDAEAGTVTVSDAPPQPLLYYGTPWMWVDDGRRIVLWDFDRGFGAVRCSLIDPATGAHSVVVSDTNPTVVDTNPLDIRFFDDGAAFLWLSERSGWNHAYLYDTAAGELRNAVTSGHWFLRYMVEVDETARVLYAVGAGREPDRDPYYRHLYRVGLDGSTPLLLTPENADHDVHVSPDARYFVDTWSTVNQAPVSAVRRCADGHVVMELGRADISALETTGWIAPEPFTAKARDGETDIYGVIWWPSDYDPAQKYPVINKIYTGPHNFFVPKGFWAYRDVAQAMAEVGFIVVAVDGMGTGKRSKAFHDVSYKNLGEGGHADHIAAIRQLAERDPSFDLERVGIYGFSAGGYDAARALLTHPEFYQAAVAASGNHDHRLDKAWWNEMWMGFPVGEEYAANSNFALADQLEGKLFLAHGELDENVHPYNTIRLVEALIAANKDFDLLIMPNKGHYLWDDPYFIRRQWDFFVRHLWGVEPPAYRVGEGAP